MIKNELKYYSSLLQKKFRKSEQKFIVEGKRLVEDGLNSDFSLEKIIYTKVFQEANQEFFIKEIQRCTKVSEISEKDFDKLADTKNPQGIAAVFEIPKVKICSLHSSIITALENISDPGNLGTILRTCDWFGIEEILLSSDCAEVYNPKVLRASMGAVFHQKIYETLSFYDKLKSLQREGYSIIAADLDGENIFKYKAEEKIVIVFCNEANGPTPELEKIINKKITIPQIGKAESLNVASAAAVIISQLTK